MKLSQWAAAYVNAVFFSSFILIFIALWVSVSQGFVVKLDFNAVGEGWFEVFLSLLVLPCIPFWWHHMIAGVGKNCYGGKRI